MDDAAGEFFQVAGELMPVGASVGYATLRQRPDFVVFHMTDCGEGIAVRPEDIEDIHKGKSGTLIRLSNPTRNYRVRESFAEVVALLNGEQS